VIATLNCPKEAADVASNTKTSASERIVRERMVELMRMLFSFCTLTLRLPATTQLLRVARMRGWTRSRNHKLLPMILASDYPLNTVFLKSWMASRRRARSSNG